MTRTRTTVRRDRRHQSEAVPATASAQRWLGKTACASVALAAFVLAFHKLDDFDTWWHLSAGRWIATNQTIPATDTLSHTVRDHVWVNVQWGFDLVLYALHSVGGPALLSVVGAIVFLVVAALLLRLVARDVGDSLAAFVVLLAIVAAQERVTLRPELLSFLLLAAVLSVLEYGRRSDGRGLFLLVPLMIIWANVHSLFIVGAFAIVCAFVGTASWPHRRLLIWGGVALAAVLVNPFVFEGALFPLKLLSRINGATAVFQTIGEFESPLVSGVTGVSVVFYKILLGIGCAAALAALMVRFRRFDWGGLIFFVGLAVLSGGTRRNVALFAIGGAPFIGWCVAVVLESRPRWQHVALRRAPLVAAMAIVGAAVVSGTVVTGALYKFDNSPQEFGAGVIEGAFPERAAAFAREAGLPGRLYNDMASGGYLTWDDPSGEGVFVDGRLEVYDTAFVTEYVTAVSTPARWQADADRYGVQTAIIFHRFEPERVLAGRLFQDTAWSLVYYDEVAAIFVRAQGNDEAIARAASIRPKWDARTNAWLTRATDQGWPYPAGRVAGTRAYARFAAGIGRADAAIAAYLTLIELGIRPTEEIERRLLLARYFVSNNRQAEAREQARGILAIDPQHAEALRLLQ
ncbi:MAG: hypothetical protein HQ485_11730 [Acidobacteria bacterium]|nr:hypothetical protein [Acidobacteriota bacterium]